MTAPTTAPMAAVAVERKNGSVVLCFQFPATGRTVFLPMPTDSQLKDARFIVRDSLEKVLALGDRLTPSWDTVESVMKALTDNGWRLAMHLTGEDVERIEELQDAFRQAWRFWRSPWWPNSHRILPTVEMSCQDDDFVPIELLPVFDFYPERRLHHRIVSTYDLSRAASAFLGFSAVVKRINPERLSSDTVLRNVPGLPVQFIRHARLTSVGEEHDSLSVLPGVDIDGPWPVEQNDESVLDELARSLFFGTSLVSGPRDGPPVQFHHFACHCNTDKDYAGQFELVFTTTSQRERRVTLAQLQEAYRVHVGLHGKRTEQPVVFLNACGSSQTSPLTSASFPRWFLKTGHRAFIGTEVRIPDDVAAEFSKSFYRRLLEQRRSLGSAVVLARRDLITYFRNPLGLLYVMYGNADLKVEYPRPQASRKAS